MTYNDFTMDITYKGHKPRVDKAHKMWRAIAIAYMEPPTGEGMTVHEIVEDPRFRKHDGTKYNRSYIYQILAHLKAGVTEPQGGE